MAELPSSLPLNIMQDSISNWFPPPPEELLTRSASCYAVIDCDLVVTIHSSRSFISASALNRDHSPLCHSVGQCNYACRGLGFWSYSGLADVYSCGSDGPSEA
ncbi:hypothetical protein XENOCAPTIV_025046 [Xenoophorus captivus]|uniref:Uncharacterized protein n=1 Tax=Xenoophorus captivus TaxID=1517983 RepID=A0ABV0QTE6_9TELE